MSQNPIIAAATKMDSQMGEYITLHPGTEREEVQYVMNSTELAGLVQVGDIICINDGEYYRVVSIADSKVELQDPFEKWEKTEEGGEVSTVSEGNLMAYRSIGPDGENLEVRAADINLHHLVAMAADEYKERERARRKIA